jgi:flagellar biosynthesis protein FliR
MMNSLYLLSEVKMLIFALILLRMIAFIFSAPVFGAPQISVPLKILFCIIMTLCIFPAVNIQPKVLDGLDNDIISLAGREVLVGLCLGFLCRIFFYAITMTGDFMAISLGLSAAQMFNPHMGEQGNIIEQFYGVLGMLFFFMVGGHHIFIGGLVQSYEFIKVGALSFNVGPLGEVATMGQTLFLITVKMCAPVMVAILLSQIAMGLLGRAIPQINVLVTSFPVTIMIGLGVMILCMPLYMNGLSGIMDIIGTKMLQMMKAI